MLVFDDGTSAPAFPMEEAPTPGRMRLVSGPQGPRVLVDGQPVLVLCSDNYLGLADHPRLREAAADAAMRWGVGAGAPRVVSGNMTVHRRLEERLAAFHRAERCVLFGSGYLAGAGTVAALADQGGVLLCDELSQGSLSDGGRLAGVETLAYRHRDLEHLGWALRRTECKPALVATEGVFAADGAVAPLGGIVELARRHEARVVVDEGHSAGVVGPGGRGTVADAGLEDEVDLVVGTLGKAFGSYGGYACCDRPTARYLSRAARTLALSSALGPPAAAAAIAAIELVSGEAQRVERLGRNASVLREALADEGLRPLQASAPTHIIPVKVGAAGAAAVAERALGRGIFVQAVRPAEGFGDSPWLRLTVMAPHTRSELRSAAKTLATVAHLDDAVAGTTAARSAAEPPVAEAA